MNPAVREAAEAHFADSDRVHLIEPLEVVDFHNFAAKANFILTDSGGVQEEAIYYYKLDEASLASVKKELKESLK